MTINRREFLLLMAVSGGVTAASYDLGAPAQPDLLAVLGPEWVRAIGLRYREMAPAEDPLQALRVPHAAVASLVREDFVAGRTVLVHGWVLSVTEARQCALFSLVNA
ncbi:MAG TPA: hypothetical protein VM716_00990 [Gemmatimonadales bacterium]|nr:hypothetical protein [Gemmatimonadales bacterium]